MSSENAILPSLRNIEWKTLKIETNKINHILPYIPTNNITELNELIYEGAKISLWENWDPLKKAWINSQNQDGKFDWKRK